MLEKLIDFLMNMMKDPKAQQAFDENPQKELARHGLSGATDADVRDAKLIMADRPAPVREVHHTEVVHDRPVQHIDQTFNIDDRDVTIIDDSFNSDNDTDVHSVAIQDNDTETNVVQVKDSFNDIDVDKAGTEPPVAQDEPEPEPEPVEEPVLEVPAEPEPVLLDDPVEPVDEPEPDHVDAVGSLAGAG